MKHKAAEPKQVSDIETAEIVKIAEDYLEKDGDFVELGCYRGDTSVKLEKLLESHGFIGKHLADGTFEPPKKRLWIYDSFEGLPKRDLKDGSAAGTEFKEGELLVTKREVIEKFKRNNLKLPIIKKAFFENLDAEKDLPEKIAFAFLDGDLYTSIKTSLKLVENKRPEIILIHDYYNYQLQGVSRATDEWLSHHKNWKIKSRVETLAILEKSA